MSYLVVLGQNEMQKPLHNRCYSVFYFVVFIYAPTQQKYHLSERTMKGNAFLRLAKCSSESMVETKLSI